MADNFVTQEEGELLAKLVRAKLQKELAKHKVAFPEIPPALAKRKIPAFVTLWKHDDLRGCIGNIRPNEPIGELVLDLAIESAVNDPRFSPTTGNDVDELDIEVSLLSPFEPIKGPDDIEIGKHGVMIEAGWHRGLYLPEVATDHNMSAEEFLAHLGLKAGLNLDAYKRPDAKLFRFTTLVFWDKAKK